MSVPVARRHRSDSQYAMTAKLIAEKIYEIADNNPKRRDMRLNTPMALVSAEILKHAMNAYSTYVQTEEDYKYRRKHLRKALKHMDMLESYLDIWWMLQERQLSSMKEGLAKEEFIRKRDNLYDQLGDMIVQFRDEVSDRLTKDKAAWRKRQQTL